MANYNYYQLVSCIAFSLIFFTAHSMHVAAAEAKLADSRRLLSFYGGHSSSSPKSGGSYGDHYGSSTPTYGGYGSSSPKSGESYGKGTPKYWCEHPEHVPKFLSLLVNIAKLFGPHILSGIRGLEEKHKQHHYSKGHELTLFDALKDESSDPMASLLREGSASLINSFAYSTEFSLSSNEVISRFNNALDSPDDAKQQASQFEKLNKAL